MFLDGEMDSLCLNVVITVILYLSKRGERLVFVIFSSWFWNLNDFFSIAYSSSYLSVLEKLLLV